MPSLINVPGLEKTSEEFRQKVIQIAANIQTDANFLLAIMSFESGATFSPSVTNGAGSGAVGLIQFMRPTAKALGTSTDELVKMSAVRQLDFVEQYFMPFKGRLRTIEDAYMAVLFPKAIGKGNGFVLFTRPSKAYTQNRGLDGDGDGRITVAEAAKRVRQRLGAPPVGSPTKDDLPHMDVATPDVAVLSKGMESPAVGALQDELIDLGYLTLEQKKTGPNIFGNKTETAVKALQHDLELMETGAYDAATQAAVKQLNTGVKFGSEGGVVLPVQQRLVAAKFLTQAQLDTGRGIFGNKTQTALQSFQLANNIQPTGIVDDASYRVLFRTVPSLPPDKTHGSNDTIDTVLPEGPPGSGYTTYNREAGGVDQFGTQGTIRALQELALTWAATHPTVLLQYGDISRKGGGPFFNAKNPKVLDHGTHRDGRACDIRPISKGGALIATTFNDATYDQALTLELAKLIRLKFPKAAVLFNDPKLIKAGLTKQHPNHDNHLHVLFK